MSLFRFQRFITNFQKLQYTIVKWTVFDKSDKKRLKKNYIIWKGNHWNVIYGLFQGVDFSGD